MTYIHAKFNQKEYAVWRGMKKRCTNKNSNNYKYYGGRGIKVCDEWMENFDAFFEHIGPAPSNKHEIDRIDCNKDYMPGNVRWSSRIQQSRNRRNVIIINGMTLNEISKKHNVKYATLYLRYREGREII